MEPEPEHLLALLRRRAEAAARPAHPVGQDAYVRFLLRWHGVRAVAGSSPGTGSPAGRSAQAGGAQSVLQALARLEGLALPASIIESDLLSSRLAPYEPHWLDELCSAGELRWVGAGAGRVLLARREVAGTLFARLGITGSPHPDLGSVLHGRIRDVLARTRSCFFRDLVGVEYTDEEVLAALWELVWAGEVTCDGFASLRAAVTGGSRGGSKSTPSGLPGRRLRARPRPGSLRAAGPPAGQGRWSLVADLVGPVSPDDASAALVMAEALLERYGVLTGEALRVETIPGGIAAVHQALDLMTDSGLALRGHFVTVHGGDGVQLGRFDKAGQFALPEAVGMLNEPVAGLHLVAAADPANAYGASVPWPPVLSPAGAGPSDRGPARVPGAHVVLVDGVGSLYVERGGRGLLALRPLDGRWEEAAIAALVGAVRPPAGEPRRWRRLALRHYPEELASALAAAGFVPTPKGLALYG